MQNKSDELNMSVSPVITKDGRPCAYVSFSDGTRQAEALIPECRLTCNRGFSPEELSGLKDYLKANKEELMKTAKGLNVMDAFMGKKK
jgi:hypothetical protein